MIILELANIPVEQHSPVMGLLTAEGHPFKLN